MNQCLLATLAGVALAGGAVVAQETLTFDIAQCAGLSGFRAHWDQPIPVAENGERLLKDSVIKDRGQTAVWDGLKPGPLAFDAVHRSLLVRFPGAAEKIADALAAGKAIEKVELLLPYLDEELWPTGSGGADYPCADGYRYRMNWDCDKLYRAQRPNWHAIAYALRRPWQADAVTGPTYNAAVKGAVYWKRFGATDTAEDRFPAQLGPVEVSSYKPEGRLDVTAVLADAAYGASLAERLRRLSDCGFLLRKLEVYDARYFQGAYEWAISTGPRAILVKTPQLVVTLKPGKTEAVTLAPPADVAALAAQHAAKPLGAPSALVPSAAEVAKLNEKFMTKPGWMPDWQYAHVRQLMGLERGGQVQPFYYRVVPQHVINRAREVAEREAKQRQATADVDYAVYLAWLDWVHGQPPRWWDGHLTAANNITAWYNFRAAMPGPVQESVIRCWDAWLMPDRETQLDPTLRRQYDDTSGKLVHPMVDDPRVGRSKAGKPAEWNQGDTYYKLTGDWRGNKSYYRSGFTREMSTANFNSSAASGALLNGQIIGSERAVDDGRAGLMQFPFWLWTWNAGVGQEYIDHYYWAIATAGNKLFPDFCERPEDRMAGWSIIGKTVNDLAMGYHPGLRKLIGPASRTYYEHVLGQQDGLYHILHVQSRAGVLCDLDGYLPALSQNPDRPISAWGHDYSPDKVAQNSLGGPWAETWMTEWIDEKPLPWSALAEKKVVAEGDLVTTWFGPNYGLSSIRATGQRLQVQGKWRRKPTAPTSMRDLGTLDILVGYNQTQIGCDGEGGISKQGEYRIGQHRNKLILLARPNPAIIARQAGEVQFGQKKRPAQEITSVQCTVALFDFELPQPTWNIRLDGKPVAALPAVAKFGQVITIQDGVSYLAIRPLPTTDIGRDAEVTLEVGQAHTQAYHEQTRIQAALQIHANFYRRAVPLPKAELDKLKGAYSGFAIEMGDEAEYGSFVKFEEHVRGATLQAGAKDGAYAATYVSGEDTIAVNWPAPPSPPPPQPEGAASAPPPAELPFAVAVNGADPYAAFKGAGLWQDTTLSQMGLGPRLEKGGAVVARGEVRGKNPMLLQLFPQAKTYVCTNPVPGYQTYSFRTPDGVRIVADGACSMGRWAVKDAREIDIKYHAFGGDYAPKDKDPAPARVLLITGAKGKPQVTLNAQDVSGALRPWKQAGADGWLVSLTGTFPPDDQITARLASVQ